MVNLEDLEIKIFPVPKHSFSFVMADYNTILCHLRIYLQEGVIYTPNFNDVEEYRRTELFEFISSTKLISRNLTHEFLHKWLLYEIGVEACNLFDLIDKTEDHHYILSSIGE